MDKETEISIIIPVKNGAKTILSCLKGLISQTLFNKSEIIIIDSGSTDNTLELIKPFPVRLFKIPPTSFNHGATRNYAVTLANGNYVVMTVQDAIPANETWLENILAPFKDHNVSAVCGQQIVPHHADKNPHDWFRPISKPELVTYHFMPGFFDRLPAEQKQKYCRWDDVTAAYRKSVLLSVPFQPVMFGEDMLWAKKALSIGLKIAYTPFAQVEHYHPYAKGFAYKRTLIAQLFKYKTFGTTNANNNLIKNAFLVIYRNIKWKLSVKWIFINWRILVEIYRANKTLSNAIKRNAINKLELRFQNEIPIGNQN